MPHVIIYSGGMDSYTLLRSVQVQFNYADYDKRLLALSFDYGQRHRKELDVARRVCEKHKILHEIIPLGNILLKVGGSALTSGLPVPHGHYAADNMKQKVVPGRNTIMLSIALAFAERMAALNSTPVTIQFGAHGGDHHIYPDCRPGYISALDEAFSQASDYKVMLVAPFSYMTKGGILREGRDIATLISDDYADTWTCYEGGAHPCGKCGACVERAEAFASIGWRDPLVERAALAQQEPISDDAPLAVDPHD